MPVEITPHGRAETHPQTLTLQSHLEANIDRLFRALELQDPELSVLLTDNEHIQELNRQWRGEDVPTDVLSFPLYEPDELTPDVPALGDIVISLPYAERLTSSGEHRARVAEELDVSPDSLHWTLIHEVMFLFIHGLLHLVGHDHAEPEEEQHMKAEERRLWELVVENLNVP